MKLFIVSFSLLFCSSINAQCKDACCSKATTANGSATTIKSTSMVESTAKNKTIACKLTSPELQKRKENVIASLKAKILEKAELENGFRYKFAGTDELMDEVTAFIKSERACCDFFDFTFSISEETLWLTITGPNGTKSFIKDEMGF